MSAALCLPNISPSRCSAFYDSPNHPIPPPASLTWAWTRSWPSNCANRLQAQLGEAYRVSRTLAFDYPTISKLAVHLAEQLPGQADAAHRKAGYATHGAGEIFRHYEQNHWARSMPRRFPSRLRCSHRSRTIITEERLTWVFPLRKRRFSN